MAAVKAATVATLQLGKTRAGNLLAKTLATSEKVVSAPINLVAKGTKAALGEGGNIISKGIIDYAIPAGIAGTAAGAGYAEPGDRSSGAMWGAGVGLGTGLGLGVGVPVVAKTASVAGNALSKIPFDKIPGVNKIPGVANLNANSAQGLEDAAAKTLATMAKSAGATTDDLSDAVSMLKTGGDALDTGSTGLSNVADELTKSTEVTNLTNPRGEARLASQADEVLDTVQSSLGKTVAEEEVLSDITNAALKPRYDAVKDVPVSRETDVALRSANPDNVSGSELSNTIKSLEFRGENVASQLADDLKLKPFNLDDLGNARPAKVNSQGTLAIVDDKELIEGLQAAKDPNKYLYESVVRREINNNPDGFRNEIGYQTDGTIDPSQMSLQFSQKLVNAFTQAKEGIKKFTLNVNDQGKVIQKNLKKAERTFARLTADKNKAKRAATTVKGKAEVESKYRRRLEDAESKVTELQIERGELAQTLNKSRKNIRTLSKTANKAIKSKSTRQVVRTIGDVDKVLQEAGAALKPNQGSGAKTKAGDEGKLVREDVKRILNAAPKDEADAYNTLLGIKADRAKATKTNEILSKIHTRIQGTFLSPGAKVGKVGRLTGAERKTLADSVGLPAVRGMEEGLAKLNKRVQATPKYLKQGKGTDISKYTLPDTGWMQSSFNFLVKHLGVGKVRPAIQRELASAIFSLDKGKAIRILKRSETLMKNKELFAEMQKEVSALIGKEAAKISVTDEGEF